MTSYFLIDTNEDTDLIEMDHYDAYRKEDGELYTNEYLLKCKEKLLKNKNKQIAKGNYEDES